MSCKRNLRHQPTQGSSFHLDILKRAIFEHIPSVACKWLYTSLDRGLKAVVVVASAAQPSYPNQQTHYANLLLEITVRKSTFLCRYRLVSVVGVLHCCIGYRQISILHYLDFCQGTKEEVGCGKSPLKEDNLSKSPFGYRRVICQAADV